MAAMTTGNLHTRMAGLFALAVLLVSGCEDDVKIVAQREAERAQQVRLERMRADESRILGYETERARLAARLSEVKSRGLRRLAQNKMAAAALVAAGGGAVGAFSEGLSDTERNVAIGVAAFGVGYCLFNYSECEALTLDIQKLSSEMQGLQGEIEALSRGVGHRLVVINNCSEPHFVAVEIKDPVLGSGRYGWWNIGAGMSNTLLSDGEFYLRTTSQTLQYVAFPGQVPAGTDIGAAQMKAATGAINDHFDASFAIDCQ
ncbi:hypothetical protein [Mesorhizobium sp. L-2-11]|uniref:hypothetical protein n=1 Tax=Mesorhizobium sp. L-2-11 TaxID=2744521 RepID=UPI0019267B56|nr:hypothetical protein [Mesorhizobium sp. L-2-11]BCH15556.1 hypothetical protein MesoLjLa_24070 [Mesorhizobium sp. L-2-11]